MNYNFNKKIEKFNIETIDVDTIISFFSHNKYKNMYFFEHEKYLGFLNFDFFVENGCNFNKDKLLHTCITDFFDYKTDHKKIFNYFSSNPNHYSAIVINNGNIVGEFTIYTRYNYSFSTQKKISATRKIEVYHKEISDYISFLGNPKIAILQDIYGEKEIDLFNAVGISEVDRYEIVLDPFLPDEFISYINMYKNLISIDEFVALSLLYSFHIKGKSKKLYFINEPFVEESKLYDDEKENIHNKNKLIDSLTKNEYIEKTYFGFPLDEKYLRWLGNSIHSSTIIMDNGVYKYVSESKISGDFCCDERVVPSNQGLNRFIDIYGPCTAYSLFTTKESSLAEHIKKHLMKIDAPLDVRNLAVPNGGDFLNDIIKMIYETSDKTASIIFINQYSKYVWGKICEMKFNAFDLTKVFVDKHYWFFNQNMHFTPKGNMLAAKYIVDKINLKNMFQYSYDEYKREKINSRYYLKDKNIEKYKEYLKNNKFDKDGVVGFVELNASPFTNGHKYLIDYSRKNCDYLYVFVTENNPNALPFYDRFAMIKEYCDNFSNTKVLTGSDFIGSQYTISAYYNKKFDMKLNAEEDLLNYKELVVDLLDVDIRFMGEEPDSCVTNSLNEAYLKYSDAIGKKTIIISRYKNDGTIISASSIRDALKNKKIDYIKDNVPKHVYEYLMNLDESEITEA